MKYNCFEYINKMLEFSYSLVDSQVEYTTVSNILKQSERTKEKGIQGAMKQFLPPIDREDIASIFCIIHSLNYHLAYLQISLFSTQQTQFSRLLKDVISYMQYTVSAELKISVNDFADSTERMHFKLFSTIQNERLILSRESSTTSFNTKNLIKNNFFDKIESIHEILHRLTNEFMRVMVKFS